MEGEGHIDKDDNLEVFMTSNYTVRRGGGRKRYRYNPIILERTLETL
jgi:hypothetical protein